MQPVVKAAMLCDYALTSDDGKLSTMGIFSNINFPSVPNAYPRFFVVIIIGMDSGNQSVRLGIVDPIGQQILPDPPEVEVPVEMPGADTNLVIDFNNLVFNRAGIYQVQLFVSDLLIHSIPLSVQVAAQEGFSAGRAN
jgi:hypothetical protein